MGPRDEPEAEDRKLMGPPLDVNGKKALFNISTGVTTALLLGIILGIVAHLSDSEKHQNEMTKRAVIRDEIAKRPYFTPDRQAQLERTSADFEVISEQLKAINLRLDRIDRKLP